MATKQDEFPVCENCGQKNSLWYVAFPNNGQGFPYLMVCKVCIANIEDGITLKDFALSLRMVIRTWKAVGLARG